MLNIEILISKDILLFFLDTPNSSETDILPFLNEYIRISWLNISVCSRFLILQTRFYFSAELHISSRKDFNNIMPAELLSIPRI